MPEYAYKAARADGTMVSGTMEADDELQLASRLQQNGLFLIEVRQDYWRRLQRFLDEHAVGRLSRRELVEFCNNLAVMLKAGVPLTRSLEELGSDSENKTLKRALERINQDILAGSTFTQALHKRRVFPELFCNLVEIGEHSGNLDQVLRDLAEHYKKIDDLVRNTRKALIYPAFILLALLLAAYVFLTMVFPPLFELLEQFDVPLPAVTRVVMAVSHTLKAHGFLLLGGALGFALLIFLMRRYRTTKRWLDWLELNLPPLDKLFIQMRMAFFMRYMALVTNAGIDLIRGLKLASNSIGNLVFQEKMATAQARIIEGALFSEALRESRYVPRMTIRMVAVGEESGTLPEQMKIVADYYSEDLERKIAAALTMLEPLLLFVMAGLALALVMGILLPLYNLVSQLSSTVGGGGM